MKDITRIAVKATVDPMTQVMECLLAECEVVISHEVLEAIKKMHSYTQTIKENKKVYTFYKRVRGTNDLFSFLVTTGTKENKVSDFECVAELGRMEKSKDSNAALSQMVYVTI